MYGPGEYTADTQAAIDRHVRPWLTRRQRHLAAIALHHDVAGYGEQLLDAHAARLAAAESKDLAELGNANTELDEANRLRRTELGREQRTAKALERQLAKAVAEMAGLREALAEETARTEAVQRMLDGQRDETAALVAGQAASLPQRRKTAPEPQPVPPVPATMAPEGSVRPSAARKRALKGQGKAEPGESLTAPQEATP
jgi:hypothetical protein